MAVVLDGTFSYRSSRGVATLASGAVLLGNAGDCFECGHQHSVGDRCLSFHFDPGFYEAILAGVPGAKRLTLEHPALPPQACGPQLLPGADAVLDDPTCIEEFAVHLVASVATRLADAQPSVSALPVNTGKMQELAQWIESQAEHPLPLLHLARLACMSPYHLLREFKRVMGITPHQFVLSLRMRLAARRLRHSSDPVLEVALDSGFSDLSEFNRRFRRVLGVTPRTYRARHQGITRE